MALAYIDGDLTQRGLAHNTIRDRLVSLGGFWSWMASRGVVGANPWTGHRISKKQNAGTRPPKRPGGFTPEELTLLLKGNERTRSWPTWAYLPDLMVLGMFTGSRIEKLCDLTPAKVEKKGEAYLLRIEGDKTDAGTRLVGVTHPAAVAVLKRRLKGRPADANLFPELSPGGLDDKMSASASKAFGRYRRACGVPDGTDFHSFRRNVVDILVRDGRGLVEIARFVGHKVGSLATDTYAGQSLSPAEAVAVAGRIRYPATVENLAEEMLVLKGNTKSPESESIG